MFQSHHAIVLTISLLAFFVGCSSQAADRTIFLTVGGDGVPTFTEYSLGSNSRALTRAKRVERLQEVSRCGSASGKGGPAKRLHRSSAIEGLVRAASLTYAIDEALLHAVIQIESGYNSRAVSRAGAVGLMQLMPATAARFGVNERTNERENIIGGTRYLRYLIDMFNGDLRLALAAYNAGEGAVLKYGSRIPPYAETKDYVRKVLFNAECFLND
jgi:Transglycosylase SLT domain